MIADYFKPDGSPVKCMICGNADLKDRVVDAIDHLVCEFEVRCAYGHLTGYWAYGSWDPCFKERASELLARATRTPVPESPPCPERNPIPESGIQIPEPR